MWEDHWKALAARINGVAAAGKFAVRGFKVNPADASA